MAAPPAKMISDILQYRLETNNNVTTSCLLQVQLQEFVHFFESPVNSNVSLKILVEILDKKRQRIEQKYFSTHHQVFSPDAKGAAKAFSESNQIFGDELIVWLEELKKTESFNQCY